MAALATSADIVARIGALTASQAARVDALLDDASGLVRQECRFGDTGFETVADDVITLRSTGKVIVLPVRPVTAVSQVAAIGVPPVSDLVLPVGSWVWDGADKIELMPTLDWIINLPAAWSDFSWSGTASYQVTYSHGYSSVPAGIKTLVCNMVARTLTAPSISDLVGEAIGGGDYSWQAQQSVGAMGAGVRLTKGDRDWLERNGYIRTAGTSETPIR